MGRAFEYRKAAKLKKIGVTWQRPLQDWVNKLLLR